VGAACWALVIGYAGFAFGSSWGRLVHIVGRVDRIAFAIIAGCAVVLLLVYLMRRKKSS
jgi:membrane protein DedA with SNARE-associated domain